MPSTVRPPPPWLNGFRRRRLVGTAPLAVPHVHSRCPAAGQTGLGPNWVFRPQGQSATASEPEFRGRILPGSLLKVIGPAVRSPMNSGSSSVLMVQKFAWRKSSWIHLNFAKLIHRCFHSVRPNFAFRLSGKSPVGIPSTFTATLHHAFRKAGKRQHSFATNPALPRTTHWLRTSPITSSRVSNGVSA